MQDAKVAFETAVERGAKPYTEEGKKSIPWPAVYGIGNSLIYFIDTYGAKGDLYETCGFQYLVEERAPKGNGFLYVDHMTNNVPKGELDVWADFYTKIFNFREIRFFDIKGCLLYTSPSPRDATLSRMPSSA